MQVAGYGLLVVGICLSDFKQRRFAWFYPTRGEQELTESYAEIVDFGRDFTQRRQDAIFNTCLRGNKGAKGRFALNVTGYKLLAIKDTLHFFF